MKYLLSLAFGAAAVLASSGDAEEMLANEVDFAVEDDQELLSEEAVAAIMREDEDLDMDDGDDMGRAGEAERDGRGGGYYRPPPKPVAISSCQTCKVYKGKIKYGYAYSYVKVNYHGGDINPPCCAACAADPSCAAYVAKRRYGYYKSYRRKYITCKLYDEKPKSLEYSYYRTTGILMEASGDRQKIKTTPAPEKQAPPQFVTIKTTPSKYTKPSYGAENEYGYY